MAKISDAKIMDVVPKEETQPPLPKQIGEFEGRRSFSNVSGFDDCHASFKSAMGETVRLSKLLPEDMAQSLSFSDRFTANLENLVSANNNVKYYILVLFTAILGLVLAALWCVSEDEPVPYRDGVSIVFQLLATGGFDGDRLTESVFRQTVHLMSLIFGLMVFAVLVGFVNDSVAGKMESLSNGESVVASTGHTLILGWNESTVRCICQIALLRRTYKEQNETISRRLFPWLRSKPSTPVAAAPVVVLCNTKGKQDMDSTIKEALAERGINPRRTRIGWDIICRVGDPSSPHDLFRVGAHRATSILCMMTEADKEEEELSNNVVQSGVTLRTLLALRHVIFKQKEHLKSGRAGWRDFRCVLHLESFSEAVDIAKFCDPFGNPVVQDVDLRAFVNSLMFNCSTTPGMSAIFMNLLDFENCSFRCNDAVALGLVNKSIRECRFIWSDAVMIGVVDKDKHLDPLKCFSDQGLACHPERRITPNDRVIFVSETTFPTLVAKPVSDPQDTLEEPCDDSSPFDVLVCGWRSTWSDVTRLKARIEGVTQGLTEGSYIEFLNQLDGDNFTKLMQHEKCDFEHVASEYVESECVGSKWKAKNGVFITHEKGDAADMLTLKKVMKRRTFEAVIVLGTVAGKSVSAMSQDTRVMSTMLLIRGAHKELHPERHLHVVGENNFDSTSMLSLSPGKGKTAYPDFVNTQAINARVLTQALAYPVMQPAIAQLFHQTEADPVLGTSTSPRLWLAPAGKQIVPEGRASFAQVTHAVAKRNAGDILLGYYRKNGDAVFAPPPDHYHPFEKGDALIIITRRPPHQDQDDCRAQSHQTPVELIAPGDPALAMPLEAPGAVS